MIESLERIEVPAEAVILEALPAPPEKLPVLEALPAPPALPLPLRVLLAGASKMEWLFGTAVLMVGLAVLATLPVLQFLSQNVLLFQQPVFFFDGGS